LRHVLGLVATPEHAQDEPEHSLFVRLDELVEGAFVVGEEPLDETLFALFVVVRQIPARKEVTTTVDRSARGREGHAERTAGGPASSHHPVAARPPPEASRRFRAIPERHGA
jgi:hypothetical protein